MFENKLGFSLIEVLIAQALGLILVACLFEIYLANQHSFELQTALHKMQNVAKTALNLLESEVQKSGNIGCARLSNDFVVQSYGDYSITPANSLMGSTNEIIVRYAKFPSVSLIKKINDNVFMIENDVHFSQGDILLISTCQHAELVQIEHVANHKTMQTITTRNVLKYDYEQGAEVSQLVINRFFVAQTKRLHPNGKPVYALYVQDIGNHTSEIVEDISYIQIMYSVMIRGVLTDQKAENITDWENVKGINITLQVTSDVLQPKTWYAYASR